MLRLFSNAQIAISGQGLNKRLSSILPIIILLDTFPPTLFIYAKTIARINNPTPISVTVIANLIFFIFSILVAATSPTVHHPECPCQARRWTTARLAPSQH